MPNNTIFSIDHKIWRKQNTSWLTRKISKHKLTTWIQVAMTCPLWKINDSELGLGRIISDYKLSAESKQPVNVVILCSVYNQLY